jgi:hypothetical protein
MSTRAPKRVGSSVFARNVTFARTFSAEETGSNYSSEGGNLCPDWDRCKRGLLLNRNSQGAPPSARPLYRTIDSFSGGLFLAWRVTVTSGRSHPSTGEIRVSEAAARGPTRFLTRETEPNQFGIWGTHSKGRPNPLSMEILSSHSFATKHQAPVYYH